MTPPSRRRYLKKMATAALGLAPAATLANAAPAAMARESERISVLDFLPADEHAAIRDHSSRFDCTSAIQAAIDFAIYGGGKRVVHIPAGRYRISGPIHLGYGDTFTSVTVEGDGYAYRAERAFNGTAIVCLHGDAPAFNFQGGRGSVLRDLSIAGTNAPWIVTHKLGSNRPGAATLDDTLAENWVDPALGERAASRWAPYAAITIDAYSGKRPAVAYPDVRYPAFLGALEQYGKAFSSDCLIENVHIRGFAVGICNQPCDADGNGDFTTIRRATIEAVQYAISVGNTQSRNVRIDGVRVGPAYCALTTRRHGRQAGKLNGTISELSVAEVINVLDLGGTAYAGPLTFLHLYGEAMWRIGDIQATSSNETSVIFQSCLFAFTGQNPVRGIPATVLAGGQQAIDIQFVGCAMTSFPSVLSMKLNGIRFEGTALFPSTRDDGSGIPEHVATAHNATCGGLVLNGLRPSGRDRIKFKQIDLDTGTVGAAVLCEEHFSAGARTGCIPIYASSAGAGHDPYGDSIRRPRPIIAVAKPTLKQASLDGRLLRFTLPASFTDAFVRNHGFEIGDIVWDDQTGTVFFVSHRDGTDVAAEAQNNYRSSGENHVTVSALSMSIGNLYSTNCRLFTPSQPLFGDVAGSAISNVHRLDGYVVPLKGEIAVGDALFVDAFKDAVYPLAAAAVTGFSNDGTSITMAGRASATQLRRRLDIWIRRAAGNK